jgi:hypothetical protein
MFRLFESLGKKIHQAVRDRNENELRNLAGRAKAEDLNFPDEVTLTQFTYYF